MRLRVWKPNASPFSHIARSHVHNARNIEEGAELIDLFRRHADASNSFTSIACLNRSSVTRGDITLSCGDGRVVVTRYSFPRDFASPHRKDGSIDLSAVLAIFDEVSTWALFAADKTSRPGVSVHLSAVAHWDHSQVGGQSTSSDDNGDALPAPPRAGEELEVVTTVTQCGRTLAFLNVELRRPVCVDKYPIKLTGDNSYSTKPEVDFEVLASGKHVKFLPVPGLGPRKSIPWDALFAQSRFGLSTSRLVKSALRLAAPRQKRGLPLKQLRSEAHVDNGHDSHVVSEGQLARWAASIFPLNDVRTSSSETTRSATENPSNEEEEAPGIVSVKGLRQSIELGFASEREHCNGLGTTHGGVQVILAEAAGRRLLSATDSPQTNAAVNPSSGPYSPFLAAITANYLTAHRYGPLQITATTSKSRTSKGNQNESGVAFSPTAPVEVGIVDYRNSRPISEVILHFEK